MATAQTAEMLRSCLGVARGGGEAIATGLDEGYDLGR